MIFSYEDLHLSLDDKFVSYSPFLSAMIGSGVGYDRDANGAVKMDDIARNADVLQQYISFLKGEDFRMDDKVMSFFDMMGHENKLEYPISYWKVKLQDNWIRDNMYRLRLHDDSYYGLVRIPIMHELRGNWHVPEGFVVAGGAALYMSGATCSYSDIDVFVVDKEKALFWMEKSREIAKLTPTLISSSVNLFTIPYVEDKMQIILRSYTSVTEVVHDFDVDCCGIVWDPNYPNEDGTKGALFATKRAHYAITHMENWVDPSRASPSYAYRLAKYQMRDINIRMPLFNDEFMISGYMIQEWQNSIFRLISSNDWDKLDDIEDVITLRNPKTILQQVMEEVMAKPYLFKTSTDIVIALKQYTNIGQQYGRMFRYIATKDRKIALSILPRDPVSILILASYKGFFTSLWSISDYEPGTCSVIHCGPIADLCPLLTWKEQDPMAQTPVSSTFYPTPVSADDIIAWYRTSPFVDPSLPLVQPRYMRPKPNIVYYKKYQSDDAHTPRDNILLHYEEDDLIF